MALRWLSLLLVLAALPQGAGSAQALKGEVLSIGDGDTIRVRQDGRAITVRLACIDAPEMAQRPYGQQARSYLQQRLPVGREVNLDVKTTDRYGRTVAEVFSGLSINLALVEDGQAFAYRAPGQPAPRWRLAGARRHHPPLGLPPWSPFSSDSRWHHSRRTPVSLQRDRLLCPCPGAAAPGAHLSRQQW